MFPDQTPDPVLWKEVQQNNSLAFATLFKRYWSDAFTSAFIHLKDRDTCADLVQDIFLGIWEKRTNLNIDAFKPYIQAAARYHVYRFMRMQKLSRMTLVEDFSAITSVTETTVYTSEESPCEIQKEMDHFLASLPKRCREIFYLSRKDHLSNDEIAALLAISKRTVENQLTNALRHIRELLKEPSLTGRPS